MMFHGHRDLYNALLEQRRSAWQQQGRHLSFTDQSEEITLLRAEARFWQKFNAQSMQVTAKTRRWGLQVILPVPEAR